MDSIRNHILHPYISCLNISTWNDEGLFELKNIYIQRIMLEHDIDISVHIRDILTGMRGLAIRRALSIYIYII